MPRSVKVPRSRKFGVPSVQVAIFSAVPAVNCAVGWCSVSKKSAERRCATSMAFIAESLMSSLAMLVMSTVKRALASWPCRRMISPAASFTVPLWDFWVKVPR
ncbi:MAG: hypothetical protein ABMA01_20050 [Chthoniobacteraceae bacterium]